MINIIAAIGKNRELGKDNKLLWHIPEDMDRFKKLTSGQIVIMGRKTYDSLPERFRPLPNRINIVITKDNNFTAKGAVICHSIEQAIDMAKKSKINNLGSEIYIIGGAQIYSLGINYVNKLYLTVVDKEYPEADAFFPDYSQFKKTVSEEFHQNEKYKFKFVELTK